MNPSSHKVCQRSEKKQGVIRNLFTEAITDPQVRKRVEKLREMGLPKLTVESLETQHRDEAGVGAFSATIYEPCQGEALTDQEVCSGLDWICATIQERGLQPIIEFFTAQSRAVA